MSKRSASPPAASGKDAEAGPSTSAGPSNNVDSHDAEPPVKRVKTEPEGGEDDEGEAPSSPSVARNDQSGGGRGRNKRRGQGGGVPNTTPGGKDDRIGGPRGNKRMKDKWDSRSRNNERKNKAGKGMRNDEEEDEGGVGADGQPKLPKKKVAMLIGYSGMGYNGSQINPGVKTIESEVFEACVKAGAISADNSDSPQKVGLMRAARTDAGVSAAINVLNLKLILSPPSLPADMSLADHINTFLPAAIKVWSIIRVQGGFHSRTLCDSRMYNYSLPTYCFLEPKDGTLMSGRVSWREGEESRWKEVMEEEKKRDEAKKAAEEAPEGSDPIVYGPSTFQIDQKFRKNYRIPPDVLELVRSTMKQYLGSHNYWNFTVGKEFGDRSCQRVMKAITVSDPFMVEDTEWISLKFHGQSFMLHQIRKMTALVIMAVRTRTPASLIPECFGPSRLNIPKAPALGLLLEQPIFEGYNRRIAEVAARSNSDDANEIRDPVAPGDVADKVEEFKHQVVFKAMHSEEEKDDTYAKWLNLHDSQLGTEFDYLNSKGVIPSSAVMAKRKGVHPPAASTPSAESGAASTGDIEGAAESAAPDIVKAEGEEDAEDEELVAKNKGKAAADLEG